MRKLWAMLAHSNGAIWNASQLAASLRVSYHTVNRYVGIQSPGALDTHSARGASWEAFVIDQLASAFKRAVPGSQPYFWRTAQGDEVDCLIDRRTRRVPFEIRLHSSPTAQDAQGLGSACATSICRAGTSSIPAASAIPSDTG